MQSTRMATIFGDKVDPRVRLDALFGGGVPESGQPPQPAIDWARGVLRANSQGPDDVVATVRTLRRADPRLTLAAATFLATHLTHHG